MTRPNSTQTLSNIEFSDQRFAAGHESSPKNDISSEQGFIVEINSHITPEQLAKAGFEMRNFRFYPSAFEEVKKRLAEDFIVDDCSTDSHIMYGFYHYPF